MNRRDFLRFTAGLALNTAVATSLFARAGRASPAVGGVGPYGPLQAADANGLMLPAGFRSRVVAIGGQTVPGSSYTWHGAPDGGAVFRAAEGGGYPSGYIYVSNSEKSSGAGGVGALRFDWRGRIEDAYSICTGTSRNCAGGAAPWGTWLTCEETSSGRVHECDPTGTVASVERAAMGTFNHEATAADPVGRRFYLTEDRSDSLYYRFTPSVWGDLSSGLLEAALVDVSDNVTWATVPDPAATTTPTRYQVAGAKTFNGGEGIAYSNGHLYFTTKGDGRVWDHDLTAGKVTIFYDDNLDPSMHLTNVDNAAASRAGDILIAEDPGNLEIVLLTPSCVAAPVVRITGQSGTEVTGPAFDPLGRRLYFSSQRDGESTSGTTYEVEGPFRRVS